MNDTDHNEDGLELTLEEQLGDLAADIVTEPEYAEILRRLLFGKPSGQWFTLEELCEPSHLVWQRADPLEREAGGELLVSWMNTHATSSYGPGFVTMLYAVESLIWSSIAIHNKDLLYSKLSESKPQQGSAGYGHREGVDLKRGTCGKRI